MIHCSRSGNTANATQNAASSLCDEIVTLWRLATLNPKLSPSQRQDFLAKFRDWHISTIEKVKKARSNSSSNASAVKKGDIENFPGFKPAIEACALTWDDYPIPSVTYSSTDGSRFYYHFGSNKPHDSESKKPSRVQPVTICSQDIISTDNSSRNLAHSQRSQEQRGVRGRVADTRPSLPSRRDSGHDGAMSSGSEGFCEPERGFRDSDSSGDYKGNPSRSNSLEEVDSLHSFAPKSCISSSSKSAAPSNAQLMYSSRQPSLDIDVFDESIADLDAGICDIAPNINPKIPSNMVSSSGACSYSTDSQPDPQGTSASSNFVSSLPSSSKTSHMNAALSHAVTAKQAPSSHSSSTVKSFTSNTQPNASGKPNSADAAAASQDSPRKANDEYQIYYYDTKVKASDLTAEHKKKKDKLEEPNVFAGLRNAENMQDVSFYFHFIFQLIRIWLLLSLLFSVDHADINPK